MSLHREFIEQGRWLFRWRSYLPFAFLSLMIPVITASTHDGTHLLADTIWPLICLACSLTGLAIRVHCVGHAAEGTSGRNTKEQVADDINTTGLYSVVRHPLYLGNFLISLGIIALPHHGWLIALFTLAFVLYYERIMYTEEAFLSSKFGEKFDDWARVTPAFVPSLKRWTKPCRSMNFDKAAKQESAAVAVITIGFLAVELGEHYATGRLASIEIGWTVFAIVGAFSYLSLRVYKHRTRRRTPVRSDGGKCSMGFTGNESSVSDLFHESTLAVVRTVAFFVFLSFGLLTLSPCFAQQEPAIAAHKEGDVNLTVSRVYTFVDKTGLGHQHAIEGKLAAGYLVLDKDSDAGKLVFDMTSFDADTPAARKHIGLEGVTSESTRSQVNENMRGSSILHVARYPTATFEIRSSRAVQSSGSQGSLIYRLLGTFTLHGKSQPLSLDVNVSQARGWLNIRGNFPIKQTTYGITPYTKAFGAIGVADTIRIYGDLYVAPTSETVMAAIPERK